MMIIIIAICILGLFLLNSAYKRTNAYYNKNYMHFDFKKKKPAKIVVFGSTYSRYAFDAFRELRFDFLNYTLNSQCIANDYTNFKKLYNNINKNSIILIGLAPCSLMYKGKEKFHIPGNRFATLKQALKYRFPIINIKGLLKLLVDEGRYVDVYDSGYPKTDKENINNTMRKLVRIWEKEFDLKNLEDNNLSKKNKKNINENLFYLDKIISMCIKKEAKPIIVITPFSKYLNSFFSEKFINLVLINPVKQLKNKYDRLQVLNYQFEKEFQDDVALYMDGGFLLNRYGSMKLINKVNNDLNLLFSNQFYSVDYEDFRGEK